MNGSPPWLNISRCWMGLKQWITPCQPVNLEAWRALPLWRPHVNQIDPSLTKCQTAAQRALRDGGLRNMADITDLRGHIVPWNDILLREIRPDLGPAYQVLIANIKPAPELRRSQDKMPIFFEGILESGASMIWKFSLPAAQLSEAWIPFLDRSSPDSTYLRLGQHLIPRRVCCPGPDVVLYRVLVGNPTNSGKLTYFGPW